MFQRGNEGHYYSWEDGESSDPRWDPGNVKITDLDTGEEIREVVWCNTATGELERMMLDAGGRIAVANEGALKVIETRNFKVEFPGRGTKRNEE